VRCNVSRPPLGESNRIPAWREPAYRAPLRDRYLDQVHELPSSPSSRAPAPGAAWFDGRHARDVIGVSDDPASLDGGGWWAVVVTFEGRYRLWRFGRVDEAPLPSPAPRPWAGPRRGDWRSSLDEAAYRAGVDDIRGRIRNGDVYQVNLCRVLEARWRHELDGASWALAALLAEGNPAPYAGVVDVPPIDPLPATRLVCASPELFLERDGDRIASGPIKGTAATAAGLLPKDEAENVMIVDLVRNDLQRVSRPGSVAVPSLLRVEQHPGLVHLVSTVEARLTPGTGWRDLLAATLPPGSVSGAPKSTALQAIRELEPVPRGPYCGAIGYVDADRGVARLAVGIRTFWWEGEMLRFGTGAGITWDSDPEREWAETELKAARLIGLAGSPGNGQKGDSVRNQVSRRVTAASRSR
jgi:para-aminobenzoate synthetase component I